MSDHGLIVKLAIIDKLVFLVGNFITRRKRVSVSVGVKFIERVDILDVQAALFTLWLLKRFSNFKE